MKVTQKLESKYKTSIKMNTNVSEQEIRRFRKDKDKYGVIYNNDNKRLLKCENSNLTKYIIKAGTKVICDKAFWCRDLQSISIPSSVTAIGDEAFYGCTALQSVSIPSSVTHIGDLAFYECTALQSVSIPSSVTTIGKSAFSYCDELQSITIPTSVTAIGKNPFSNCI